MKNKTEQEYTLTLEINEPGWRIKVWKPVLTEEEYARRHKELEKATIALLRDNPPKPKQRGGITRGRCAR